jgi:hypothetical protein
MKSVIIKTAIFSFIGVIGFGLAYSVTESKVLAYLSSICAAICIGSIVVPMISSAAVAFWKEKKNDPQAWCLLIIFLGALIMAIGTLYLIHNGTY